MTGGLSEPGRMAEEIFSREGYLDYTKQMLSIPENPPPEGAHAGTTSVAI